MANFIMASRWQALALLVLCSAFSVVLAPILLLANGIIALVTLKVSVRDGALFALIASVAYSVSFVLLTGAGFDASKIIQLGIQFWLVVYLAHLLARSNSWKTVFLHCAAFLSGLVVIIYLLVDDVPAYWIEQFKQQGLDKVLQQLSDSTKTEDLMQTVGRMFTGWLLSFIALLQLLSLMIARSWHAKLDNPGGFGDEFRRLSLGRELSITALIIMLISALSVHPIFNHLLIIMVFLFLFQGLSLAHYMAKKDQRFSIALVICYVLLVLQAPVTAVLLATIGMIDNFANFRKLDATAA